MNTVSVYNCLQPLARVVFEEYNVVYTAGSETVRLVIVRRIDSRVHVRACVHINMQFVSPKVFLTLHPVPQKSKGPSLICIFSVITTLNNVGII